MPRGTGPTPEQKAARARLADARRTVLERKQRTRRLIQLGGVLDAWGVNDTQQVESLMRATTASEGWKPWRQAQAVQPTDRWPGNS